MEPALATQRLKYQGWPHPQGAVPVTQCAGGPAFPPPRLISLLPGDVPSFNGFYIFPGQILVSHTKIVGGDLSCTTTSH